MKSNATTTTPPFTRPANFFTVYTRRQTIVGVTEIEATNANKMFTLYICGMRRMRSLAKYPKTLTFNNCQKTSGAPFERTIADKLRIKRMEFRCGFTHKKYGVYEFCCINGTAEITLLLFNQAPLAVHTLHARIARTRARRVHACMPFAHSKLTLNAIYHTIKSHNMSVPTHRL